jgi:hypothetical protein
MRITLDVDANGDVTIVNSSTHIAPNPQLTRWQNFARWLDSLEETVIVQRRFNRMAMRDLGLTFDEVKKLCGQAWYRGLLEHKADDQGVWTTYLLGRRASDEI